MEIEAGLPRREFSGLICGNLLQVGTDEEVLADYLHGGHSLRSLDELVDLLRAHGVKQLIDIRFVPRSRHNPQFNRDTFSKVLRNRHLRVAPSSPGFHK